MRAGASEPHIFSDGYNGRSKFHCFRALVVNTGNANAGTGVSGLAIANATWRDACQTARLRRPADPAVFHGVILEPLPLRPRGHHDRHQQGRGNDPAEHGNYARVPGNRRQSRAAGAR